MRAAAYEVGEGEYSVMDGGRWEFVPMNLDLGYYWQMHQS